MIKEFQDQNNVFFRCVEDSAEPIMITNPNAQLVYVNPAWVSTYGYSKEEALGKSPRMLRSPLQDEHFYKKMWSEILNPKIGFWKGELVNKTKDAKLVTVLLTITPYKNTLGEILGYMGIAVDITAQKELEKRLLHQDKLASIGLLASGLAHEVGTPMGVIRGRAEFLLIQNKDNTHLANSLQIIIAQIDRISKLIRSLLRVSRTPENIHLQKQNLKPIVLEMVSLVEQKCHKNKIKLLTDFDNDLSAVLDSNLLQQILLNLVINSIHAIEESIRKGKTENHVITVTALKDTSGMIKLNVTDTGSGISPANMNKLFQPFFTTKDIGSGTGLGLAIVAKLIEDMHGKITVESQEGVGTTFSVHLQP